MRSVPTGRITGSPTPKALMRLPMMSIALVIFSFCSYGLVVPRAGGLDLDAVGSDRADHRLAHAEGVDAFADDVDRLGDFLLLLVRVGRAEGRGAGSRCGRFRPGGSPARPRRRR